MSDRDRRRLLHAQALAALTEPVEEAVRAALRSCYRSAFKRMGFLSGALPTAFSVDDLATIPVEWKAAVDAVLLPALADVHGAGALAALTEHGPAPVTAAAPGPAGAGAAGGDPTAASVVVDFTSVVHEQGVSYLADATNRLVGIGDTSWNEARATLTEGMAAGESVPQLADRLNEVLDTTELRAITIARTEVVSAANQGAIDGVRALGEHGPGFKQWMATLGPRTREWHAEADGQTVPLDEPFIVDDEEMDAPGDPNGSAENVVNCRCTVVFLDDPGDGTIDDGGRETGFPTEEVAASGRQETSTMRIKLPRGHWPASAAITPTARALTAADAVPGAADPAAPAPVGLPEVVQDETHGNVYPFSALITVEGRWTGDNRLVMSGGLDWEGMLPLPLTVPHDDDPNVTVGLVLEVERVPGPNPGETFIMGRGVLDAEHPMVVGTEDFPGLARQIAQGFVRGCSMDIDAPVFGGIDPATVPPDSGIDPDDAEWIYSVVATARLRALAVTSLPAFVECYLTLGAAPSGATAPAIEGPTPLAPADMPEEPDDEEVIDVEIVVASATSAFRVLAAAPDLSLCPPPEWFADPKLPGPTPLTVTDDGRVYGHLAQWGVCHTGIGDSCVMAPKSPSGYAAFRTGEVVTADGSRVAVGGLTVGTGHAGHGLLARPAAEHYDHTGTRVANVAAGEDRFGVWVAGSVTRAATPTQVELLRACPLSGDWRRVGTGLDLVAALSVNVPGFPVPRIGLAASGQQVSLTAAGVLAPGRTFGGEQSIAERIARTVGRDHATRAAQLRSRVHPVEVG